MESGVGGSEKWMRKGERTREVKGKGCRMGGYRLAEMMERNIYS